MTNSNNLEKIAAHNQRSLKTLTRAIAMGRGKFSLIIVRCNYESLQEQILPLLRQKTSREIEDFLVPQSATSLYTAIKENLGAKSPDALIVLGLESVKHLDDILRSANIMRDKFRSFPFPIVLWLTDLGLKKLMQQAPDFNTFASAPIRFSLPDEELGALICGRVDAAANDADNFEIKRAEIDGFRQDLASREDDFDGETKACFAFLDAWDLARDNQIDAAVKKYRESLAFWELNSNLARRGLVLLCLGFIEETKGKIGWEKAADFFQKSLEYFESGNRQDLAAKYIGKLGELLKQKQDWQVLKKMAQRAIKLHENYNLKKQLAIDYGWLARVALEESQWKKAEEFARKALAISESKITTKERGLFLLILGQSLAELGEAKEAINYLTEASRSLETARAKNISEYDAKLHVEILKKLRLMQFEQKQYLAAFQNKLLQREIESQYGWRAFVGAGILQASARDLETKTAEEIVAVSGRKADLESLIARIKNPQKKLTVIHGQSGVGKSSLLQGGLIPTLQLTSYEGRDYVPISVRVYQDWVNTLGQKLADIFNIDTVDFSPEWILSQLRENERRGLLTILIFDQFEEFFFDNPDAKSREDFYGFLEQCLDVRNSYVKVILSLREDYLYYLLELDRKAKLNIDKNYEDILYYLGNFSREDAKEAIVSLTERSQISLDSDLVEELVEDLGRGSDGVRPIGLQVVGAQLETEEITTLKQYRQLGEEPKEVLVERFLEDVVKDCGEENKTVAELVLYLLTSDKNTRPLKTARELKENLEGLEVEEEKLDLVLEILVGSGLVLLLPEIPENFYQLVHDYLVPFVRKRQSAKLVSQLRAAKAELNRLLQRQLQAARYGIAVLVVLLVAVGGLWFRAEAERKRAEISEIKTLNINSEALFSSNQQLEALLAAVKAGKKLNRISAPEELREETKRQLAEVLRNIRERNRLEKHTNQVLAVSFSPDGKFLVSGGYDDTVKLWRSNGTLLKILKDHKEDVIDAIFSPNGELLASASRDGTIKLWNREGEELQELSGLTSTILEVSFSPDNLTLALGSADATVKLWNFSDGSVPEELGKHDRRVTSLSFSSNGELASASCDGTIKLWNRNRKFPAHTECVERVRFSPDGELLASGSEDTTVKLWNRDGSLLKTLQGHSELVKSVAFSPDGRTLASAGLDGAIVLWHRNGTRLGTLRGHTKGIYDLSFSGEGTIASAGEDTTVRLWQYQNSLLKSFPEPRKQEEVAKNKPLLDAHINSNGRQLVLLASGDVLELWTMDGNLVGIFPEKVEGAGFAPDGQTFASFNEKEIKLWKLDGSLPQTLPTASTTVINVTFSPDGRFFAALLKDGNIDLWSLDDLSRRVIPTGVRDVLAISFSPDAKFLVSASDNGRVTIWRLSDLKQQTSFRAGEQTIYQAKFSPNGQIIATASGDNTVKLWTLDGVKIATLEGHSGRVWDVAFSSDSSIIASVSTDDTIRLWSIDNGTELQSIQQEKETSVFRIKFAPNGEGFVTMGYQSVNLWKVEPDKLKSLAQTLNELDALLESSCDWLKDYLQTNRRNLPESDRSVCDEF